MRRPRWLLALLLALAVAAGFAWLGRWQLERAVVPNALAQSPTETQVPLTRAATPGESIANTVVGQKVSASGTFAAGDYQVLVDRLNDGDTGYWVVGRFTLAVPDAAGNPVVLAVARGWANDKAAALAAVHDLEAEPAASVSLAGRLLPSEGPKIPPPDADPHQMSAMSAAALYNVWSDVDGTDVYDGYVVQRKAPAGLTAIHSPPPIPQETINWLNLFYALEWVVFAGFAVYMWYRLARDAWERERELLQLQAADAEAALGRGPLEP